MFLNHNNVQNLNTAYLNTTTLAQSIGKPVVMFETNTASCGGFSGLSDSFAASMWTVDYSLNMAMSNFSHALYHVGGQSDYYNVPYIVRLVCSILIGFFLGLYTYAHKPEPLPSVDDWFNVLPNACFSRSIRFIG